MSDDDLEILFENLSDRVRTKQNSVKASRVSVEQAKKLKSDATEYLSKQQVRLKTKFKRRSNPSVVKNNLIQPGDKLPYRSVKQYNGFAKQDKISCDEGIVTGENSTVTLVEEKTATFELNVSPRSSVSSSFNAENIQLSQSEHTDDHVKESSCSLLDISSISCDNKQEEINELETCHLSTSNSSTNQTNVPLSPENNISFSASNKKKEPNNLIANELSFSSPSKQNIRLSRDLEKRKNKFSINGSPASSRKNSHLYSDEKKSPKNGYHKSPLTFMRSKLQSPNASGVKRKLSFSSNPPECEDSESNLASSIPEKYSVSPNNYIYRQFKLRIEVVLDDSKFQCLFNEEEIYTIYMYREMNYDCQDLYARMHSRKCKWNRLSDIKYDSATKENVQILENEGLISTDLKKVGIETLLELLKLHEIKDVCKSLGIRCSVQNKMGYSEEIIRYIKSQKTINWNENSQELSSEYVVRKKIQEILGLCFVILPEPRDLFRRIHFLFNLNFNRNEQSRHGSQDLFEIQFMGTNKIVYPKYKVDETARIFTSREDLLRFQTAEDLKLEYFLIEKAKKWNEAETILNKVRDNFIAELNFINKLDESSPSVSASQLPLSLRKFTPGAVYAYILSVGVDVLKRLKKKEAAISDLKLLLSQTTYLPYKRGEWYEKLITIYRMAGNIKKATEIISTAVSDSWIDDVSSYVISCRVKQIMKKKNVSSHVKCLLRDIPLFPELEIVESVEIKASTLDGKTGYKRVYVQEDKTGDGQIYSSVEELVKNYYCPTFFKKGFHCENSLPSSLFGILFWDVIYDCYVPCAFISPFQTKPFDLSSGEFYKNRQTAIDKKIIEILKWTSEEVASWVNEIYDRNYGKTSVVSWAFFRNSEQIVDIINCIGLEIVVKICERLIKKYRSVRGGFPDLFLWTPGQKNKYKFVEVKSHNDKLSTNQKLWLDYLLKIEANIEVCWVRGQGSKTSKLTPTADVEGNDEVE